MLFLQFRLFFVWLTKSLRQLNGDAGPQANQLPAIDRLVHYPLNFYNCRGWYSWMNEIVLWAVELKCNIYISHILCIWQCRGGRLFTYSLWKGPSRSTPCTRHRWPRYGCQTVSYLFQRKCKNLFRTLWCFLFFYRLFLLRPSSDHDLSNTHTWVQFITSVDSNFFLSWILEKRSPGWRS